MSTIGTITRHPAVVQISVPNNSTLLRGMGVFIDSGTKLARVPGATTENVYGIATMDADTDMLYVSVAAGRGGFTVQIKPSGAVTFAIGDPVYYNSTALDGSFTNVVGTGLGATKIGWIVDKSVDAYGLVEMAFITA